MGGNYDFIITGDFRFPGGTSSAIAEEIKFLKGAHWSWKLNPFMSRVSTASAFNDKIASLTNSRDILTEPEAVGCGTWFIHNPHCLRWGIPKPRIQAGKIVIVCHQAPISFDDKFYYDPWWIDSLIRREYPGVPVIWAPISPLCRALFHKIGFDRPLLEFDWVNVFSGEEYAAPRRIDSTAPIRIGCHGRPQAEKWPGTREAALLAYPDDPAFKVTLLGADPSLSGPIFPAPKGWDVFAFNGISLEDYFARIDFFVYCPRPDWVETFGRTVAEAILNGKIAILPKSLEPTFGELARYAGPSEIAPLLKKLCADPAASLEFATRSAYDARRRYGTEGLASRLQKLQSRADDISSAASGGRPWKHAASSQRLMGFGRRLLSAAIRRLRDTALRDGIARSGRR